MTAIGDQWAAAEAAKGEFEARRREWNALCRQHGGSKATIALAWGQDEALAKSIRAVRWPMLAAEGRFKKAKHELAQTITREVAHV